jgi:multiple sugar transport system permease protein
MGILRIGKGEGYMKRKNWMIYLALSIAVAVMVVPFIWMLLTSFKTFEDSTRIPLQILPEKWVLTNYQEILEVFPVAQWFMNSLLSVVISIVGQVFLGSLAAYAFARLKFPGKEVLFLLCLSIMMIPEQIFIIPRYNTLSAMGLTNTRTALWIVRLFSVFAVFLMRQFILSVPNELDEAAMVDGAGHLRIYATIILPVLKAPVISLAILSGLTTWKDMMWPLIVIRDRDKMPVVSGLSTLADYFANRFPHQMAGGVLCSVPVIIFFFILQKHFVAGIASQGIKE